MIIFISTKTPGLYDLTMNFSFTKHILSAVNWVWLLITLLVFSALIKLGLWQSDRAQQKEIRLEKIESLSSSEFFSTEQVASLTAEQKNDLPITTSGYFNNDFVILLDNQINNGTVGYRVFQIFTESGTNLSILVNLGWIAGGKSREILPATSEIKGKQSISGNIRIVDNPIVLSTDEEQRKSQWPLRVQEIDLQKLSTKTGYKLAPYVLYLSKDSNLGYVKNWQPIVMPPEKHRGYAFQWFSLAIAWLSLMIWAAYKNNKRINQEKQYDGS